MEKIPISIPFDSWDRDIKTVSFENFEELRAFLRECQPVMDQVTLHQNHDRFSFFVDFYQKFKGQSTMNLLNFYLSYREKGTPDETRQDCIGRTLKFLQLLPETLKGKDSIYVASNTFDYLNFKRQIDQEAVDKHHYYENFNEHNCPVLKFAVDDRIGYLMFEMSYMNKTPIIVMRDNLEPSTGTVTLSKGKRAIYTCKMDNYVEVEFENDDKQARSIIGIHEYIMALYVGAHFKRQDVSAKFCVEQNFQYRYAIRDGKLVASVSHYGDDKYFNVQRWDDELKDFVKCKIPMDYFVKSNVDESFEAEIGKLAYQLQQERNGFREMLATIANIQHDNDFIEQLRSLPITLRNARATFVRLYKESYKTGHYLI